MGYPETGVVIHERVGMYCSCFAYAPDFGISLVSVEHRQGSKSHLLPSFY